MCPDSMNNDTLSETATAESLQLECVEEESRKKQDDKTNNSAGFIIKNNQPVPLF